MQRVMREIGQRMEKFARLMGVPFRFRAEHHSGDLAELDLDALDLREGTGIAVNCVNALRGVLPGGARRRDAFAASLRRLDPRVVTVVEEEADLVDAAVDEVDRGGVGAIGVGVDDVGCGAAPPCEWKCRDEDADEKSSSM